MSLNYAMYFDGLPAEVRSAISSFRGAETVDFRDGEWIFECGLLFSIYEIPSGDWTVVDELGLKPRSVVRFLLSKHGDLDAQQLILLRLAMHLLSAVPGDAVLLFYGEEVWLQRREGQLILNSQLWDEDRLAVVAEPYELRAIPSI